MKPWTLICSSCEIFFISLLVYVAFSSANAISSFGAPIMRGCRALTMKMTASCEHILQCACSPSPLAQFILLSCVLSWNLLWISGRFGIASCVYPQGLSLLVPAWDRAGNSVPAPGVSQCMHSLVAWVGLCSFVLSRSPQTACRSQVSTSVHLLCNHG